MKYYLIVGEASGDLHASHLMTALKAEDPQADFRFFGGDLMAAVGGAGVYGIYSSTASFAYDFCKYETLQGRYCGVESRCGDLGRLSRFQS